jgi:hypothetical protein
MLTWYVQRILRRPIHDLINSRVLIPIPRHFHNNVIILSFLNVTYIQEFLNELLLTPGLTGWAQINGRDDLPIPIKVEFDEYYLKNRSFLFDLKILFMIFFKVIRIEGVKH